MTKEQLIGKYVKATIENMDMDTMEETLEYYMTQGMMEGRHSARPQRPARPDHLRQGGKGGL